MTVEEKIFSMKTLRIRTTLAEKIKGLAASARRSVNAEMTLALEAWVARHEAEAKNE